LVSLNEARENRRDKKMVDVFEPLKKDLEYLINNELIETGNNITLIVYDKETKSRHKIRIIVES